MYLGVITIREIASFGLNVVASYLLADFVMTMLVITQWIGKFLMGFLVFYTLLIVFNSNHLLDHYRKATLEMMCMRCLNIQPIGPVCMTPSCNGFSMAKYYCSICKFFDDERYLFVRWNPKFLVLKLLLPFFFQGMGVYGNKCHLSSTLSIHRFGGVNYSVN